MEITSLSSFGCKHKTSKFGQHQLKQVNPRNQMVTLQGNQLYPTLGKPEYFSCQEDTPWNEQFAPQNRFWEKEDSYWDSHHF